MEGLMQRIDRTAVAPDEVAIFWLGQAGFYFKSPQGARIALDPYLSDCCERYFGFKRLNSAPVSPDALECEVLVASHAHYDHFDVDSVPWICAKPGTQLVAARDCEAECKRLGIRGGQFLAPGMQFAYKDVTIEAQPCDHGVETPDAIGILLTIGEKRIYFMGDSCYRADYANAPALQSPDLLILPINGAYGNLNAREAAQITAELHAKETVPCHFWTFAEHGGDPAEFMRLMQRPYRLLCAGAGFLLK